MRGRNQKYPACDFWEGVLSLKYLLSARHAAGPHQMMDLFRPGEGAQSQQAATWGGSLRHLGRGRVLG